MDNGSVKGDQTPDLLSESITFALRKKAVTLKDFERFVHETRSVIQSVERAASGSSGNWILTDLQYGSASLSVAPAKPSDNNAIVSAAIVAGFRDVETARSKPSYFSERALNAVLRLSLLSDSSGLDVSTLQGPPVKVTTAAAKNVSLLLKPTRRYYGSIVGNLDVVSVHSNPSITIYADFGEVVKCFVEPALIEERVKDLLGRRVIVSGRLSTNRIGNIVSIQVEDIFEAPTRHKRSAQTTAGSIPDFTGDLSSAEFLDSIRNWQPISA